MKLADFDYNLPTHLIAQQPTNPRDHSRLLVLDKQNGEIAHRHFYDLLDYLLPGDVLVINNSKVFPARLFAHKATSGGRVEIFLLKRREAKKQEIWQCLVGGKVRIGQELILSAKLKAKVLAKEEDGTCRLQFNVLGKGFMALVFKLGQVPLPPYIKRGEQNKQDDKSYQTVYAKGDKVGSVAAPTAGLHFTKALLKKIKAKGIKIIPVTLHVGLGTFAPVKTENIKDHLMHSEYFEIGKTATQEILSAKQAGRRIFVIGTTACRVLETWGQAPSLAPQSGWTDIFIYPGYQFKIVDALVTNFHLPKSTLLMLITALAGQKNINLAYQTAINQEYRFFSYGDAMLII